MQGLSNKRKETLHRKDKEVLDKEIEKLLVVGFIREVYYPEWLANVVMIKKANGR